MSADPIGVHLIRAGAYLIWSVEHAAWWGPNRRGYTRNLEEAGRYHHEEALGICHNALMGTAHKLGVMPELPVRLEDIETINNRFSEAHPGVHMPWVTGEPER